MIIMLFCPYSWEVVDCKPGFKVQTQTTGRAQAVFESWTHTHYISILLLIASLCGEIKCIAPTFMNTLLSR